LPARNGHHYSGAALPPSTVDTDSTHAPSASDAAAEGNSRLTSVTGIVLLVMFAVEGFTLLDVSGLITLHIVLGALLVGPVLLKIASTGYRFARYYSGAPAYVRKGPPHVILRVLGPVVIITSLAVIGTGIALGVASDSGPWGFLHRASFILWFGAMAIHVLGHLLEVWRAGTADFRHRTTRSKAPHRGARFALVGLALIAGVGTAAVVLPASSAWTHNHDRYAGKELHEHE
jgi:hypothetical protein